MQQHSILRAVPCLQSALSIGLASGLLALLGGTLAASDVIVVDAAVGAGADFATIGEALHVAAQGDTILVRAGDYAEHVAVQARSVHVFAELGAQVSIDSLLIVEVPLAGRVLVRGLEVVGDPPTIVATNVRVDECLGPVWLEELDVITSLSMANSTGGMRIHDSGQVVLSKVLSEAPRGFGLAPLIISNTTVAAHDSTFFGSNGVTSIFGTTGSGGSGLFLFDGTLYASNCSITGGSGSDANLGSGFAGGDGGTGAVFTGDFAVMTIVESTLAGGSPGTGTPDGSPGEMLDDTALDTTFNDLGHAAYSLSTTAVVRESQAIALDLEGAPLAPYWLFSSMDDFSGFNSAAFDGMLLVAPPLNLLATGSLDSQGLATETFFIPELGNGVDSKIGFTQAVFIDPTSGRFSLSGPSASLLLDRSF